MKLVMVIILLLCSCSTAKHGGSFVTSTITTVDTIQVKVKKDSLGYDSSLYRRQEVVEKYRVRPFRMDEKIWIAIVAILAILVKVYTN